MLSLVAGCAARGELRWVLDVRGAPSATAIVVELHRDGCDGELVPGTRVIAQRPDEPGGSISVPPGEYFVRVDAIDADCRRVASVCERVRVDAGGASSTFTPAAAAPELDCRTPACASRCDLDAGDAGALDLDAGAVGDAPMDAPVTPDTSYDVGPECTGEGTSCAPREGCLIFRCRSERCVAEECMSGRMCCEGVCVPTTECGVPP